jgi:hypothetical protein
MKTPKPFYDLNYMFAKEACIRLTEAWIMTGDEYIKAMRDDLENYLINQEEDD